MAGLRCGFVLVALLLVGGRAALGEEPLERGGLAWEQAADRLIAAQAQGPDALAAAVQQPGVDPWVLVDALVRREAWEAADALVAGWKGPRFEALPAYLATQRKAPVAPALRDARDRAVVAFKANDPARALEVLEAAPGQADGVPGAWMANFRGIVLLALERRREAIDAFRHAADLAGRIGWLEQQHGALQQAAQLAFRSQEHEIALEVLRLQVPLAERVATPEELAGCVINVGSLCARLQRWDEAIVWLRRGLDLTLPGVPGDARKLRNYRLNDLLALGQLHFHRGEYAHALGILEPAPALAAELGRKPEEGTLLLFLGRSRLALELLEEAVTAFEGAARVFEGLGRVADQRTALLGQAACLLDLRNVEGALRIHDQIAGLPGADDLPPALRASCLGERALALQAAGRLDEAEAAYDQALALAMEAQDDVAWIHINQATLHLARGRAGEARALLETVLASPACGEGGYLERHTLQWLAIVALQEGKHEVARAYVDRGIASATAILKGLSDAESARSRNALTHLLDVGLQCALAQGDAAAALRYAETGRGLGFLEMLGARTQDAAAAIPPDLRAAADAANLRVAEARATLAQAKAGKSSQEARAAKQALAEAVAAFQAARRGIERTSKLAAEAAFPQPADAEQIAQALAPDEALVAYAGLAEGLHAFVVRPDASVRAVPLGASTAIDAALGTLVDAASKPTGAVDPAPLRGMLVEPLRLGDEVRRVVVVPYDALNEVPFGVLMPEREVVYAPSGTVLARLGTPEAAPDAGVLALGDPDYGGAALRSSAAGPRAGVLARLPATAIEVRNVAGADRDVRLLASEATEEGLRNALASRPRWHALHIACHGLLDAERPALSSLALTPSGIDDGFLTALEVGALQIAADLVVLSACETSRGTIASNEGVVGLTRAFMLAGAPRVLCSLWKVDDEATQALMVRFYELWRPPPGSGRAPIAPATALRTAQAFVRDHPKHPEWKHPYYWGAWALWGVPR